MNTDSIQPQSASEQVIVQVVAQPISVSIEVACAMIGCSENTLRLYERKNWIRARGHGAKGSKPTYLVKDLHTLVETKLPLLK